MKRAILLISLLIALQSSAQENISIIPKPSGMKMLEGTAYLDKHTRIVLQGSGLEGIAAYLNNYLQRYYGFSLQVAKKENGPNAIFLNYERLDHPIKGA